jgi:hypothetical protein
MHMYSIQSIELPIRSVFYAAEKLRCSDRSALEARMRREPGSLWIIKPPGRNNGSGVG